MASISQKTGFTTSKPPTNELRRAFGQPVPCATIARAPNASARGGFYKTAKQAGDLWIGRLIMKHTNVDEGQANGLIKAWMNDGIIFVSDYHSPKARCLKNCIAVNDDAAAQMTETMS